MPAKSFLLIILFYAASIALTVVIETPILLCGGVTDNKTYIRNVNIVTNAALNLILVCLLHEKTLGADEKLIDTVSTAWFVLAELLLIPVSEGLLYRKISSAGTKRIFLFTYLANFASCAAGLILDGILRYFFR